MNKEHFSSETPDSQAVLNKIVMEYMVEQKRKRLWRRVSRIFFLVRIAPEITSRPCLIKDHTGVGTAL